MGSPYISPELYTAQMIQSLISAIYYLAELVVVVLVVTFFILGYLEKEDHKK